MTDTDNVTETLNETQLETPPTIPPASDSADTIADLYPSPESTPEERRPTPVEAPKAPVLRLYVSLDAALAAVASGVRLVPARDHRHEDFGTPLCSWADATTSADQIERWWHQSDVLCFAAQLSEAESAEVRDRMRIGPEVTVVTVEGEEAAPSTVAETASSPEAPGLADLPTEFDPEELRTRLAELDPQVTQALLARVEVVTLALRAMEADDLRARLAEFAREVAERGVDPRETFGVILGREVGS